MLAGIGTGLLTYDDMKKWQTLGEKVMPNKKVHEKYNEYYKLYHEIYKDLKNDMKKLTEIR
jgi:xylulokinase